MGKKLKNVEEKRSRKSENLEKNKIDIKGMKEPTNQIKKQWKHYLQTALDRGDAVKGGGGGHGSNHR